VEQRLPAGPASGVAFEAKVEPIPNLSPAGPADEATLAQYAFLEWLNRRHLEGYERRDALSARIRSYELAARMQVAVPEAANLERETQATHTLYGLDRKEMADFGRTCLLTRRLLERGVRFVQLWSGTGVSWDAHDDVPGTRHGGEAKRIDRPVAGLIRDLHARGLLDDTLVIFSSEFGRTRSPRRPREKSEPAGTITTQRLRLGWPAADLSRASRMVRPTTLATRPSKTLSRSMISMPPSFIS
jgi:hypothetical protein